MPDHLLIQAAKGETTQRVPIWIMRQAGRILPPYLKIRRSVKSFRHLVKNPELACEVTLQPVDILKVDAAIIFSDILVIPEAMNLPYELIEKKGPYFERTIQSPEDLSLLKTVTDLSEIGYTIEAIKLVKNELNNRVPLIGFAGCPWTIFAYMTEGSGSKTFSKAKRLLYQHPQMAHQLLQSITDSTIFYLKAQIAAGADIVQIFDSHAGMLSKQTFNAFSLPYIRQICAAITEVPVITFAKGAWFSLKELNELDCEVIGLDWTINPDYARQYISNKSLQGNLDPCQLYGKPKDIQKATQQMLSSFGGQSHIANLGHGVYPDTPLDNVKCFVETVQAWESTNVVVEES